MKHHLLPVSPANVHWGYFSKKVTPALTLKSGDRATIETLTHHANDDYERMIADDPGAESVFHWTREHKAVVAPRRGTDRRSVPARLRRRRRRASADRPGGDRERRARRYAGGSHSRCPAASELQRLPCRALLRLQRRRVLGLSLSRPDRGAEAARGRSRSSNSTPRASRSPRRSTIMSGRRRPIRTASSIRPSIIPACGSITRLVRKRENILPNVKVPARLHFGTMGLAPVGGGFRQLDSARLHRRQYRRLAHRQGRADVLSGRGRRRLFLGRRSARRAGRQRTRRHRDRNVADRRLRIHPAQAPRSRRHDAGRA